MAYGHFILSEGGCIALIERKMRSAVLNSIYVLVVVASMAAWTWMFVDIAEWTIGLFP
jgi:hypothetical protein